MSTMTTVPNLPDRRLSPVERKEIISALLQTGAPHYPLQLLSWMQSPVAKIAENAALLCTHLPKSALADFIPFTEQLLKRSHSPLTAPQRRLLFTFLLRLLEHNPPPQLTPSHLQLYDSCLQRIAAPDRSCIPALCMKIAAALTDLLPEIREELITTLEILDDQYLTPAQRSAKRNVMFQLNKARKRQSRFPLPPCDQTQRSNKAY